MPVTETKQDTRRFIGRCRCGFVKTLDIPVRRWTETHHNHAHGYSYPVSKSKLDYEPYQRMWECPKCSTPERKNTLRWKQVDGRMSETHKCDARCMNATGPNCECSCGGANHGGSYL